MESEFKEVISVGLPSEVVPNSMSFLANQANTQNKSFRYICQIRCFRETIIQSILFKVFVLSASSFLNLIILFD